MKTIRDFELKNKRVLVRCDFNVPLGDSGDILDDFRIKKTIPTVEFLIKAEAKVILMSHLGDPGGRTVKKLKLSAVQDKLTEYLDLSVTKAEDCIGTVLERWTKKMTAGEVLLLENLRFHKGEEENDDGFARELAKLGDIYINDAFGVCHRAHASIASVPKYLLAGIGFLLEKEIKVLDNLLKNPPKPLIIVMGGAKAETKAKLINRLSENADWILLANLLTIEIKNKNISLAHPEKLIQARDAIMDGERELDIGPETIKIFKQKIAPAETIFWNGPLGMIEKEQFSGGTEEIAKAIVAGNNFSVVGGGETVEFINKIGLGDKFGHVSTGGGALLAYLSGEKLPGLEVLQ